jgi:hypothetical protein
MMEQLLAADIPLEGALQELERRASVHGLKNSEAINWILTIPGLDEFFVQVAEHKKRIMQ